MGEIDIDTSVTNYSSGAAGNGNGGSGKVSIWGVFGPKHASCVEQRSALDPPTEWLSATATSALVITLASICATASYLGMLGRREISAELKV